MRATVRAVCALAVGCAALTACSNNDSSAQPPATNAAQPSQASQPAQMPDACTLFAPVVKQLHLTKLDRHPMGTTLTGCQAQDSAGTQIGVMVRDQGIDQFRAADMPGKYLDSTIAGHKTVINDAGSDCDYSFELGPTSRVDLGYTIIEPQGACAKSKSLATMVAKELPPSQ